MISVQSAEAATLNVLWPSLNDSVIFSKFFPPNQRRCGTLLAQTMRFPRISHSLSEILQSSVILRKLDSHFHILTFTCIVLFSLHALALHMPLTSHESFFVRLITKRYVVDVSEWTLKMIGNHCHKNDRKQCHKIRDIKQLFHNLKIRTACKM